MDFGQKLKLLREERGYTQLQLANATGSKQATITAYETGRNEPSFAVVKKFAEFFHVPSSFLFPDDEDSNEDFSRDIEILDAMRKRPELYDVFKTICDMKAPDLIRLLSAILMKK